MALVKYTNHVTNPKLITNGEPAVVDTNRALNPKADEAVWSFNAGRSGVGTFVVEEGVGKAVWSQPPVSTADRIGVRLCGENYRTPARMGYTLQLSLNVATNVTGNLRIRVRWYDADGILVREDSSDPKQVSSDPDSLTYIEYSTPQAPYGGEIYAEPWVTFDDLTGIAAGSFLNVSDLFINDGQYSYFIPDDVLRTNMSKNTRSEEVAYPAESRDGYYTEKAELPSSPPGTNITTGSRGYSEKDLHRTTTMVKFSNIDGLGSARRKIGIWVYPVTTSSTVTISSRLGNTESADWIPTPRHQWTWIESQFNNTGADVGVLEIRSSSTTFDVEAYATGSLSVPGPTPSGFGPFFDKDSDPVDGKYYRLLNDVHEEYIPGEGSEIPPSEIKPRKTPGWGPFDGSYFFDGDTPTQDLDLQTSWLGTPNRSESILHGQSVPGFGNSVSKPFATTVNGTPAIRQITNLSFGEPSTTFSEIPSRGSILGTRIVTEPLQNFSSNTPNGIRLLPSGLSTPSVPNEAGEYELKLVYDGQTEDTEAQWVLGDDEVVGEVAWKTLGVFDGAYTGPYFDGDTEPFEYNGHLVTPEWDGIPGESTSSIRYFAEVEKLIKWDEAGERYFETGIDRGVLYADELSGVAWNGLVSVNETSVGGEPTPLYLDGEKYQDVIGNEDFEAELETFSTPKEFEECEGLREIVPGLLATHQKRRSFGLSYRTLIGNDTDGTDHAYKLHLVYNAVAVPTGRVNQTIGESVEPSKFTWKINTIPEQIDHHKPTAHLIIDSRKIPYQNLDILETVLYGTEDEPARLPSPSEVAELLSEEVPE